MHHIVLDATRLTALMRCPHLSYLRFEENLQKSEGKSNSIECGSLTHTILEFFYKARIQGKNRSDAIDIGFEAGKEYLVPYKETNKYVTETDHPGLLNTPEESTKKPDRLGWRYVINTLHEYFDFWRNDSFTPIAAETVKSHLLYQDDEMKILWKAKYDLIEDTPGGFLPTDHKTMSQRRDTLSLNNQFMGQSIILASRQVRINKIGWQTSLAPEEKFQRVYIPYSVDRLAEWAQVTVPHYARMLIAYHEASYFPHNYEACEGKYGKCDYYAICESDRANREVIKSTQYKKVKPWDIGNDDA